MSPSTDPTAIDRSSPPFDRLSSIQRLEPSRSGHRSSETARHQLFVGRDRRTAANVLVKVTTKPGLVYERDLANEIASLTTIGSAYPQSKYFPELHDHGRLSDSRRYLVISLFDEWPLATAISSERIPARIVGHLRTAIEIARALIELHALSIFHVDLNPMNVLYRGEKGTPVIRVVDFESSYELSRYANGEFYSPPTTPNFCAPEVKHQRPDARADLFSLGAVLYTLLAGYDWTRDRDVGAAIAADHELDSELKAILLKATESAPDRRYAAVDDFRAALSAHLERIWPGRSW